MQKTKRNRKAGDVHKLLVLAREGEAVVLDPSEHNSNAFVPLSEVLETWKERTQNEMGGSEVKTQFPPWQSKGQSVQKADTQLISTRVCGTEQGRSRWWEGGPSTVPSSLAELLSFPSRMAYTSSSLPIFLPPFQKLARIFHFASRAEPVNRLSSSSQQPC